MDYSWLWQNEHRSDVKLRFTCPGVVCSPSPSRGTGEPAVKKLKQEGSTDEGGFVAQLPAHALVLETASGYWKSRLGRWDTPPDTAMTTAGPVVPGAGSAAASGWVVEVEEQVEDKDDADIALLVLRYAYTGKLPDRTTGTVLLKMTVWADRWDMPHALSACITAAANTKDLSLPELESLLQYHLPDSITASDQYKALQQQLGRMLCQHVGLAQIVLVSPEQLQSFCSLSLQAVLLWAAQDELKTDSEDTVAVLLTHWWEENNSGLNAQEEDAAACGFTQALRASHLSSTSIDCVLNKLPWFRCSPTALSLLRTLHGADFQMQHQQIKEELPAGWILPERANVIDKVGVIRWTVTKAELDRLHELAATSIATLKSSSYCWRGLLWQLVLRLKSQRSPLLLGLTYSSAFPETYTDALPPALVTQCSLGVDLDNTNSTHLNFTRQKPLLKHVIVYAFDHTLGVPESIEPRTHSHPPDWYWKYGKLHLKAELQTLGDEVATNGLPPYYLT